VEQALLKVVEDLKSNPPSEDEWERVTTQVESGLVANFSTNRGVAFTLGSCSVMGDWTEATRQFEHYRKVKPADLPAMAKKYLDMQKRATLVIRRKGGDAAEAADANDPQAQLVKQIRGGFRQLATQWKALPAEVRVNAIAQFKGAIAKVEDPKLRAEFEAKLAEYEEQK
jgi:hypothetical protein